jgi:hypothetical protein
MLYISEDLRVQKVAAKKFSVSSKKLKFYKITSAHQVL